MNYEISQAGRGWDWISCTEPDAKRNISILAIIETLFAMSIYVVIAIKFHTLIHLAMSACIAPLLLLRTQSSTKLGIKLFGRILDLLDFKILNKTAIWIQAIAISPVLLLVFGPGAIICKVAATSFTFFRRPVESLAAIPNNWFIISMCTDMRCPPEIIPGTNKKVDGFDVSFRSLIRQINEPKDNSQEKLVTLILVPAIMLVGFAPALLYRWSLKGTCLVWLPLLWAVSPTQPINGSILTVRDRLEDIRYGVTYKIILIFSTAALLAGVFKIFLFAAWNKWQTWWTISIPEIIDRLIAPLQVYPWHLTALLNSVVAWLLFMWADSVVRHPALVEDARAEVVLARTLTLRRFLTLYTVVNELAIFVSVADLLHYLKIDWRWLSWWP